MRIPKIYSMNPAEEKSLVSLIAELNHLEIKYGDSINYSTEIIGGLEEIIPFNFHFTYIIDVYKTDAETVFKRLKSIGAPEPEPKLHFPYDKAVHNFNIYISPQGNLIVDGLAFDNADDCAHYMESITLADFYANYVSTGKVQAIANKKGHVLTEEKHETV